MRLRSWIAGLKFIPQNNVRQNHISTKRKEAIVWSKTAASRSGNTKRKREEKGEKGRQEDWKKIEWKRKGEERRGEKGRKETS